MEPPSQKVLNWLHNVLTSEYRYVDRTYSDVAQTLFHYPWISLRTDVYTFEQGSSSLLLNLYGSLPVSFRGTTYAFPISIWVPREYPHVAPMQFVTPTKEMLVRPGQHVSADGRIYHPYLANWRNDRSNIDGFFPILQDIFAREPPLIARPEPVPKQAPAPQRNGVPPPVPPLPPGLGKSQTAPAQSSPAIGEPPLPPPKPLDAQRQSLAQRSVAPPPMPALSSHGGSHHDIPPQIRPNGYSRDPQLQAQTSFQRAGSAWDARESMQLHTNDEDSGSQQPQRAPISPMSPISPQRIIAPDKPWSHDLTHPQQNLYTRTDPTYLTGPYPQNAQGRGQVPPAHQIFHHQPNSQAYSHQRPLRDQPLEAPKPKAPEDLLTSPFEAALPLQSTNVAPPPIPRNPQKDALLSTLSQTLAEQVRSTYSSNMSAIAPLRAQQAALTTTLNNVNIEISQLDELEKLLSSNERILHQAMRDADAVLEDAKKRQVPNVDEVLFAPTVVARQLYEAVADERAVEDCRAVLMKALDKGRIGGGVWAKQTRGLAREEFLKKALIKKISRGMGLVEEDRWD